MPIGSRAPLHVTAVGKLMLGEAGAAATREYASTRLPAYTSNTRHDIKTLLKDIGLCSARGYALDDEEAELGVGCIGALIRDATGAQGFGAAGVRGVRMGDGTAQAVSAGIQS